MTAPARALALLDAWGLLDDVDVAHWLAGARGLTPSSPFARAKERALAEAELVVEEEVRGRAGLLAEAAGLELEWVEAFLDAALYGVPADRSALALAPPDKVQYTDKVRFLHRCLPVEHFLCPSDASSRVLVSVDPHSGVRSTGGVSACGVVRVEVRGVDPTTAIVCVRSVAAYRFEDLAEASRTLRSCARVAGAMTPFVDAFLIENAALGPLLATELQHDLKLLAEWLGTPYSGRVRDLSVSSRDHLPAVELVRPSVSKEMRRRSAYPYLEAERVRWLPDVPPAMRHLLHSGLCGASGDAEDVSDALVQAVLWAEARGWLALPRVEAPTYT